MNLLWFFIGVICGMVFFDAILFYFLAYFKVIKTKKFTKERFNQCFSFSGIYHLYKFFKKGVDDL